MPHRTMAGAVTCSDHYYTTEKKNEVAVSFFLPHRIVSQSLPFFSFSFFFFAFSVYSRPRMGTSLPRNASQRFTVFFWRGEELIRAGGEGVLYASPPRMLCSE
jgi:hypothetical protein